MYHDPLRRHLSAALFAALLLAFIPAIAASPAEYWLDPAKPSATDKATLWFDKSYSPDSRLRNVDDIYIYTGLIEAGGADTSWQYAPPGWEGDKLGAKYKMQRSADNPDLYSIEFTPSIAEWYGAGAGNFDRIAVIFRDYDGNKQHDDDQILRLSGSTPVIPGAGFGKYISHSVDGNKVTVVTEKGSINLTFPSKDIVRVLTMRTDDTRQTRPSVSVVEPQDADYAFEVTSPSLQLSDDCLTISLPEGISLKIDRQQTLITFLDPEGEVYLAEKTYMDNYSSGAKISFLPSDDEAFYGGGYNGRHIDQNYSQLLMRNTQTGNWDCQSSAPHNICIPFVVSTRGYGLFFDDQYEGAVLTPSSEGTTYSTNSRNPVAYYFIAGGRAGDVDAPIYAAEQYTRLTGLQPLPPMWALGYITSKFSFASRSEAEEAVSKTKNVNIPIDGIVFDIHWQGGVRKMGKIDWDTSAYPDPQGMLAGFKSQGVHSIAITEPYFTSNSGNYEYLLNNGLLADDNVNNMEWLESDRVGMIDITSSKATDWYKNLYRQRTLEGIDSWWLDLGEPERDDPETTYAQGTKEQVHNEYTNRWLAIVAESMREARPDTRFILMPRAGTAGMQRYNAFPWTGDIARSWYGLAAQIPALVSASMSGVSFLGSDIGGFISLGTDPDLYRRWVQLGVFYPSMRTHSTDRPEVWRPEYQGVLSDVRDAINLRYAYLPYTYSQAYSYARYGTPIARPANFADRDKASLRDCVGAYLWGPDILVAPVVDNSSVKRITFPEGDWLDMNDFTTVYAGRSSHDYAAPASCLPHFMRRGSIVGRYTQTTFTNTADIDRSSLTIDYFPDYSAKVTSATIYDDDLSSASSIAASQYLATTFSACADGKKITFDIKRDGLGWQDMYPAQNLKLRIRDFHLDNCPGITSSQILLECTDDNSEVAAPEFSHEGKNLFLTLPPVDPKKNYRLTVSNSDIPTGAATIMMANALTLYYASEGFTYSAPDEADTAMIEVFAPDGTLVASLTDLHTDGYAAFAPCQLPAGLYIARLTAVNDRQKSSKTLKVMVK